VGAEAGDPLSLPRDGENFLAVAQAPRKPKRVAVSRDLGITPVDPEIADLVMAAARQLEAVGVIVEEAHPDLPDAMNCFQTLRALGFATGLRQLLIDHRDKLKPEVIWNIEKGLALTGDEIARAEAQRATLYRNMARFFDTYDVLLCPTTIVPPFPVEERFVRSCNGVEFTSYVDWLLLVGTVTMAACPAMSIPCGFTRAGLPVGLQIVSGNRQEGRLLSGAAYVEKVLDLGGLTPMDPRVRHASA
jgi:amidase